MRKPLILRGARQVGKSWLVREFGRSFDSFVEINFEKDKSARSLFTGDINTAKLVERLALYIGKKISPGTTLLFLDEVQECEEAIAYLRYFKEDLPQLHVIAAGSLIEFALEKLGMPVGRVQFLYLYPMSFGEFLSADGHSELRSHILTCKTDPAVHEQILDLLKNYMWLGGMPAVLQAWIDHKDPQLCHGVQDEIIDSYRQDFAKYARRRQLEHVEGVFESVPVQLGRKFQPLRVEGDSRAEPVRRAFSLLEKAGIIMAAHHSSGQGVPLGATRDERKFKAFFFDIGLAQRILGLDLKNWVTQPIKVANVGAIAEQLVAQEFVAHSPSGSKAELYYWHRESPSSNAEVDLLFVKDGMVIPVEIKSGVRGGLKSMRLFLDSHPSSKYGLKVCEGAFSSHGDIHEVPLYGIEAWMTV